MTSAIPDMPMPPMPTKWIVPMSVPSAFIISNGPQSCRAPVGNGLWNRPRGKADRHGGQAATDALDQVGKVARGIGTADRQRSGGCIGERLGILGQRLYLAGQRFGREF